MKTVRIPSPARSQGAGPRTPIRHKHRRTLSVGSARSNASGRLTALIQQNRNMESFVVSPLASRKSILSDNTDIEEPKRKSWWKSLGENSRDVIVLLEENKVVEPNNIVEELDIEVLSQERKDYTMDLPESSDSESISSIVIPQRKLFTQKENLPKKKFGHIVKTRETLAKLHKPNTTNVDQTVNVPTRELFQNKQRSKPMFPAALLNISPNKTTADKTKEFAAVEPKAQVRNIFGNRATKRKNIFTNFIVSESEDEIPEIQPKVFGFQNKIEARKLSSSSRGIREPSPASSITTDIEMDDWKMLPSSTMVEQQLEIMMADGNSPKRARLSKLTEIESEAGSNATKQSNKSTSSKETEKSRRSKTFTKEKAPETSMMRNKSLISYDEAEEILGVNEEVSNKSRKSKTFIKEKAPDSECMTTKNKSRTSQNDDVEEILEMNEDVLDKSSKVAGKSRKSKTFTKDKAPESDSITTRNRSNIYLEDNEEILFLNKSSKDTDKRKSKTFTKGKSPDLEASMTARNKSKVSQDNEKIFIQNKSKPKIADQNTSQSSIKTRSQSKNNSPNNSQMIDEEPNTENTEKNKTLTNKNTSKIALSPKGTNIEPEPLETADQENDDDELNFILEYENEEQHIEEIPENNQSKSNIKTRASKSMTQQENSANVSKSNKTLANKVIEESAELQSTQEKSTLKVRNKSQAKDTNNVVDKVEINHEQTQNPNNASNNSEKVKENEIEVENNQQETAENQSENISEQVDDNDQNEVENNDDCEVQNETEENNEFDDQNESQDVINASDNEEEQSHEVQDQSEPDNESEESEDEVDNNESQEVDDENEKEQNESKIEQNESQEEIENESEVEQNESQEEIENESEVEQNESQEELQNESEVEQNESQEKLQNESEDEQNQSQEVEDENGDKEQNISQEIEDTDEQNESGVEDQEESEAIADSDNQNDEPNNSQDDVDNDSDNHDTDQMESGQIENQEEIEINVSHDTTGRNRKKNESPEVILHDSNNHLESFAVQGRNTSVRKTEMIKSMNIRSSLAPVRESTGFSDGVNSSTEGSGWDSHRTTRKTLRQTFGRDFTPRKSLRALVMEKSAKRQTQHKDIASVTAKFPQANSTELPEMSNRYDDEVDENHQVHESNHEVSIKTRQTMLEEYLQKIKKKNTETRLKMEEAVRDSLNVPSKEHIFKVPAKPLFARRQTKPTKPKQAKSTLFLGELPAEVIQDLKYKPPKRFQPSNAPWITKRLYKFLESKLEAKYDYKARVRAEKLVENMYHFAKDVRRHDAATTDAVDVLKREMARLDIIKTHFEFYEFFHQFMPREVRVKVVPDVVNKLSLPRRGVFSDIL